MHLHLATVPNLTYTFECVQNSSNPNKSPYTTCLQIGSAFCLSPSLSLDVPLSLWILWATLYIYRLPLLLNCPVCQIFKSSCHNHFWLIHLASKATSCLSLCVDRQTAQLRWATCTACDEGMRHKRPFHLNLFEIFLCPIYYIVALLFLPTFCSFLYLIFWRRMI